MLAFLLAIPPPAAAAAPGDGATLVERIADTSAFARAETLLAAGYPSAAAPDARAAWDAATDPEARARALVALVRVAERTGDDTDLRRIVDRGEPLPDVPEGRDTLALLRAEKHLADGLAARDAPQALGGPLPGARALAAAHALLTTVPSGSPAAVRARYLDGVVLATLGRSGEARAAFADAIRAVDAHARTRVSAARAAELDRARELAILGIARAHYADGSGEAALAWYGRIDARSPLWRVAQRESAWAEYVWGDDEPAAAARIERTGLWGPDPARRDPEAGVLLGLMYHPTERVYQPDVSPLRDWQASEGVLLDVDAAFRPEVRALEALLAAHANDPVGLYRRLTDAPLSAAARERLARDARYDGLLQHLRAIDAERVALTAGGADAQEGAIALLRRLEAEATAVERRAGLRAQHVLARHRQEREGWLTQAEIIRFDGPGCR